MTPVALSIANPALSLPPSVYTRVSPSASVARTSSALHTSVPGALCSWKKQLSRARPRPNLGALGSTLSATARVVTDDQSRIGLGHS